VWGFSVLGSPRTQRLLKYDEQKVNDLLNINSQVQSFYALTGTLPKDISEAIRDQQYAFIPKDPQSGQAYEYSKLTDTSYSLCAEFNKSSEENALNSRAALYPGDTFFVHPAGKHCFTLWTNPNLNAVKPMLDARGVPMPI
jgi:hypothetical protein